MNTTYLQRTCTFMTRTNITVRVQQSCATHETATNRELSVQLQQPQNA